jgi:predicted anti-sigma-YlaC factor YlaD
MTCRELVELVTDRLEGRLEEGDRRRFDEHLGECPDCREYVEQMRQTVRTLGTMSEDALSAPARDALLHAFQSWRT